MVKNSIVWRGFWWGSGLKALLGLVLPVAKHAKIGSPASEASREVANLTEGKIGIPPYMVSKNLSVYLLQTLTPIISGLAEHYFTKIIIK